MKELFTINEAYEALDCTVSKSMLYKLARAKKIPVVNICSRILIRGSWIRAIRGETEVNTKVGA